MHIDINFKNWILNNSKKVLNTDHLSMFYMVRRKIYDPSTFKPFYKFFVINEKAYNETKGHL